MRRPHILRSNKANQLPSSCIWFDTETEQEQQPDGSDMHSLWFGYAAFRRRREDLHWCAPEWLRFTSISEFWDWVESYCRDKVRLHLFAHNGQFDLPVLNAFSVLLERGWELKNAVVECPPMILVWKKGRQTIRFIDTLNLWRLPLDTIGEHAGLPKLEMPSREAPQSEWDVYGKRDTEIIMSACIKWWEFLRLNNLGGFAPTLASQAFGSFRHRFMTEQIFIDDKAEALEISRRSYLGGRVECFRTGLYRGQFYHLDINSMYPAVMAAEEYPISLIGVYSRATPEQLSKWLKNYCIVADVSVDTRTPIYPKIIGGKLCFPIGRLRVTLSTPELAEALKRGHVRRIHAMAVYRRGRPFSSFVDFFYGERMKAKERGDTAAVWFLKILANSLYGKFGQRGRQYETCEHTDSDSIDVWTEINAQTREIKHYRQFGGLKQHWVDKGESACSHPAIASHVTAYARAKLWGLISCAGRGNVYYCDTDCVVVNQAGHDRLTGEMNEHALGALKTEAEYTEIELYGPKDYRFGDKRVTKGVKKKAVWVSENEVEQTQFIGFKGLLRRGALDAPITKTITKKLAREYTKGRLQSDGRVLPLIVRDW